MDEPPDEVDDNLRALRRHIRKMRLAGVAFVVGGLGLYVLALNIGGVFQAFCAGVIFATGISQLAVAQGMVRSVQRITLANETFEQTVAETRRAIEFGMVERGYWPKVEDEPDE